MTNKITKTTRSMSFWAVIIVFVLPLVLAIVLYATRTHWSLVSTTQGELLNPPLTLPLNFTEEPRLWRVLYITPSCVDESCQLQLAKITSIHQATGKDFNRSTSVLITTTHNVDQKLLENFNNVDWFELHSAMPVDTGLFIMDPDGYIILKYPLDTPGAYILEDLRHLLKVSQIG
jgi:hypothetical protein